jgi:hypothetical protein
VRQSDPGFLYSIAWCTPTQARIPLTEHALFHQLEAKAVVAVSFATATNEDAIDVLSCDYEVNE